MHDCMKFATRLAPLLAAALGACGGDRSTGVTWHAVYDTIGDTIVVRTVSGSVWGDTAQLVADLRIGQLQGPDEYTFGNILSLAVAPDGHIFAYDSHAKELRRYSSDGTYLGKIGQEGGGPGEYRRADAGLAVLPDGRILLRDPGNNRINVYSPAGEYLDGWRIRGFWSGRAMYADTAGNVYTLVLLNPDVSVRGWEFGVVRYDPQGVPGDTIPEPTWDYEPPRLYAGSGRDQSDWGVAFTPDEAWTVSPLGYLVGGLATRYAFDQFVAPDSVVRIERADWRPVRVSEGERAEQESIAANAMRRTDPGWRWNGPPIPATKPPYKGFFVGGHGRIWVQLHTAAYEIPAEHAGPPESAPWMRDHVQRWIEPVAFDVFEPDGRYLGMVRAPDGLLMRPPPVARGDTVWAVVRDEIGVQYIARFTIGHGAGHSN
jgi:hypothetical protein